MGSVGAGKSSLLSSLVGDLYKHQGIVTVKVCHEISTGPLTCGADPETQYFMQHYDPMRIFDID